jgi:hypothetical protein
VFIGGGILRRLKRGRPDTWLYRQLQWRIATRHPLMAGWVGGHVLISRSGFWSTRRSTMSRFKNEITHLQAHIKTLRLGAGALVVVALVMGGGWWSAPRDLTIHVPPDLRSGSTRKWWEVPPESVYAFTFYVFQTLNRWPTNGEEDYRATSTRSRRTSPRPARPSCARTTTTAAARASCASACAASTRFPAAATATTPRRACAPSPTATGW